MFPAWLTEWLAQFNSPRHEVRQMAKGQAWVLAIVALFCCYVVAALIFSEPAYLDPRYSTPPDHPYPTKQDVIDGLEKHAKDEAAAKAALER